MKNSERETLMLLIAAEGYHAKALVKNTERSLGEASSPLSEEYRSAELCWADVKVEMAMFQIRTHYTTTA